MPKKELITACKATFKNGTTKEYNTIEEASEDTGISISAIKIRCNKKGCKGKDGTTFEWLDEHTKRSYQAKKSKAKGSAFEYEVAKQLKEIGYTGCTTSRGESKRVDNNKIDIIDTENKLPINIQCKHLANTPSYFTIRDQCSDKSKPFVILWKKSAEEGSNSPGSVAIVPLNYFYELLKTNLNND